MFTDTVWSVLATLRAERIALLDRICVRHLLRRQGGRNTIPGRHHMDLLDQFDLVMRRAAELKPDAAVLDRVFHQLVCGVLKTAASPWQLPSRAAAATVLPAGHPALPSAPPRGPPPARRQRRTAARVAGFPLVHGIPRVARHEAPPWQRGAACPTVPQETAEAGGNPYGAYLRRPVDENLAVFSSYWGRGYTCNPAAVHAAARRLAPHVKTVFLATKDHADRCRTTWSAW